MKNSSIFLYIGLSKSETRLLHEIFGKYSHLIKNEGIYHLPQFDNLSKKLLSNDSQEILTENISERLGEILKKSINSGVQSYLIIDSSNAGLHNHYQVANFYKEIFKHISLSAKVIFFLKRQDLFVESSYEHEIQDKSATSFEEYLENFDRDDLDWYKMLTPYSDIFGKKNIVLRKFYDKKEFLENFGNIIGSDRVKYHPVSLEKRNQPTTLNRLKDLTNSYFNDEELKHFNEIFGDNIEKLKERVYFNKNERIDFLKKFDESNRKLSHNFLENSAKLFFLDSKSMYKKKALHEDELTIESVSFLFTKAILEFKKHPEKKITKHRKKHPLERVVIKVWGLIRLIFRKLNLNFFN